MMSRTIVISIGLSAPSRRMVSLIGVLTRPRIFSTASFSVRPRTSSPSISEMKSPASTPALAAGVSSIGVMTLTSSFSIVTSMPRPPNSPLVWTRMSLRGFGIQVGRMRIERGQHAVDGVLDQRLLVRRRHILRAHALEDVAEDRQLLVGLGARRVRRRARRAVDQAHGGRAHQRAGKQKRQFTYHFLSFQK